MTGSLEERFQNLHEFVTQARTNLNRNNWDYLIGGSSAVDAAVAMRARPADFARWAKRGIEGWSWDEARDH